MMEFKAYKDKLVVTVGDDYQEIGLPPPGWTVDLYQSALLGEKGRIISIKHNVHSLNVLYELCGNSSLDIRTAQVGFTLEELEPTCNHKYTTYVGFTETYDYCAKCDVRRL